MHHGAPTRRRCANGTIRHPPTLAVGRPLTAGHGGPATARALQAQRIRECHGYLLHTNRRCQRRPPSQPRPGYRSHWRPSVRHTRTAARTDTDAARAGRPRCRRPLATRRPPTVDVGSTEQANEATPRALWRHLIGPATCFAERPSVSGTAASTMAASVSTATCQASALDDLRPHGAPTGRLLLTSGECGRLLPAAQGARASSNAGVSRVLPRRRNPGEAAV
jgi:hypothetical protein